MFVVGSVVLTTVAATALALLLNAQRRGQGLLRAAYFVPFLVSPVVVGLIWSLALERQNGLVNTALEAIGLGQPGWLLEAGLAMGVIILVGLWIAGRLLRADRAGRAAGHRPLDLRGREDRRRRVHGSSCG